MSCANCSMNGWCCDGTYCETAEQLRAELAAVKADRDDWLQVSRDWRTRAESAETAARDERAAHAETRKALEVMRNAYEEIAGDATRCLNLLESARASESALRERVGTLESGAEAALQFLRDAMLTTCEEMLKALTADRTGQEP